MAVPSNLLPINTKINKALRNMTFKNREHSSIPLYKELENLPLEQSFDLKNAKHMGKFHNNYLPQSLLLSSIQGNKSPKAILGLNLSSGFHFSLSPTSGMTSQYPSKKSLP